MPELCFILQAMIPAKGGPEPAAHAKRFGSGWLACEGQPRHGIQNADRYEDGRQGLWPFLADGIFTILRRMRNGENVLLAHRSHLYQRLVIAGNSPQRVTLVYGGMAAIGAVLGWFVVIGEMGPLFLAAGLVSVCFFGLWCWTQTSERKSFP